MDNLLRLRYIVNSGNIYSEVPKSGLARISDRRRVSGFQRIQILNGIQNPGFMIFKLISIQTCRLDFGPSKLFEIRTSCHPNFSAFWILDVQNFSASLYLDF